MSVEELNCNRNLNPCNIIKTLSAEKVQSLLREEDEARRPRRCCHNLARSAVYAILMAGIGYCIYDFNSLNTEIRNSWSCPSVSPDTILQIMTRLLLFRDVFHKFATFEGSIYMLRTGSMNHASARVLGIFLVRKKY